MNSPAQSPRPSLSRAFVELRRQLKFSQEDLARQIGVSYATVNRWENGHSTPSRLAMAQIKQFCDQMVQRGLLVLTEDLKW